VQVLATLADGRTLRLEIRLLREHSANTPLSRASVRVNVPQQACELLQLRDCCSSSKLDVEGMTELRTLRTEFR